MAGYGRAFPPWRLDRRRRGKPRARTRTCSGRPRCPAAESTGARRGDVAAGVESGIPGATLQGREATVAVAVHVLDVGETVARLGLTAVEHRDLVAAFDSLLDRVPPDEARSTDYEHLHALTQMPPLTSTVLPSNTPIGRDPTRAPRNDGWLRPAVSRRLPAPGRVRPPSRIDQAAAKRTPSDVLRACAAQPFRFADSAKRRRGWRSGHRLLLTACSRRNDTGWHGTTLDDTGRHVEPRSVPGRSNLRIRCPKGRGSSTLPSRTPSDLGTFCCGARLDAGRIGLLAHRARPGHIGR
jgi:hypothetical protein